MLAYLQKFNNLPPEARNKVSNPKSMALIEELEKKYRVTLAALIMKAMVGEIPLDGLAGYLINEKLAPAQADALARELKEKIFFPPAVNPDAPKAAPKPVMDAVTAELDELVLAPDAKVKGASFFFSPDDESEIRELAKKIEAGESALLSAAAIEKKLDDIINRAQINFGSAELADRFKQILKTYLRGIRNRLETRAALTKPFLSGGLSFDEDSADKVMTLAGKVLSGQPVEPVKAPPKIKITEPALPARRPEIARDADYDFSKLKKPLGKPQGWPDEKIANDLKKLDTAHELAAPASAEATAGKPAALAKKPEIKIKPVPEVPPLAAQMPLIKRRFEAENLSQNQKAKLQDVKYVPKIMGPLEELKYMDLTSFRRLERDAAKSAEKIKSKIDLLAEEDYSKKLEGIKFWRQSPLNRRYLEIGHLSISLGKPINVIIEEKKAKGEECLTGEEFKAIMDLNKSLRF